MHYQVGDFFLMRGTTPFLSSLIAEMTKGEEALTFSHAMVCVGNGKNPEVIEAVFPRVRRVTLNKAIEESEYAVCLRLLHATPMERMKIVQEAMKHEGELYGLDGYFARFFGCLLGSDAIEGLRLQPRFPDCSELCGLCLQAIGRSFGESPTSVNPNEMYAWAKENLYQWQISIV